MILTNAKIDHNFLDNIQPCNQDKLRKYSNCQQAVDKQHKVVCSELAFGSGSSRPLFFGLFRMLFSNYFRVLLTFAKVGNAFGYVGWARVIHLSVFQNLTCLLKGKLERCSRKINSIS